MTRDKRSNNDLVVKCMLYHFSVSSIFVCIFFHSFFLFVRKSFHSGIKKLCVSFFNSL